MIYICYILTSIVPWNQESDINESLFVDTSVLNHRWNLVDLKEFGWWIRVSTDQIGYSGVGVNLMISPTSSFISFILAFTRSYISGASNLHSATNSGVPPTRWLMPTDSFKNTLLPKQHCFLEFSRWWARQYIGDSFCQHCWWTLLDCGDSKNNLLKLHFSSRLRSAGCVRLSRSLRTDSNVWGLKYFWWGREMH